MFSAVLSFLGGTAFRMIFGQLSAYFEKKQEHSYEIERMKLEGEQEAARFERQQQAIIKQHELGIETIRVKGEIDENLADAAIFAAAQASAFKPTGIWFVDLWNGVIRPSAASIALFLWVVALNAQGWKMSDWDKELVAVILGFYFASRVMQKQGK